MEDNERNTNVDKRHTKQIGSSSFKTIMTILLSVLATVMFFYIMNDGILFIKGSIYGDLTDVIPVCEVIDNIEKEFYSNDGNVPSKDELVETAMKAIVDSLEDPYSTYFTAEEYDDYRKSVSGSFSGIGILVNKPDENGALISKVYEDSPGEKAGLKAGDVITAINGTDIRGAKLESVSELIKGEDGDAVEFKVMRADEELTITAYFGQVTVKTVTSKMLDDNIGYIYIDQFADNTGEEFDEAIEKLKGMKSLIIDLRNNPGGYLTSVVKVADTILDSGTIVSIGNTLEDPDLEIYSAEKGGLDVEIAVLINSNSASASEILAAAIKENDAGVLIGTTTYGKGIVQSTGKLYSTDGYLKLTTDAYYTPDGNDIHKKGVEPDVYIELPSELAKYDVTTLPYDKDVQLQRAVSELEG